MAATFVMEAQENYGPAFVTAFEASTKLYAFEATYQASPGSTFDYQRRVIDYNISTYAGGTVTNDTGANLWSGSNLIAPSGDIDSTNQANLQICQKNIDSGAVSVFNCYGATRKVPTGIQFGIAFTLVGGSGYVDGAYIGVPLTGGSGSGATADFFVKGGVVTYVGGNGAVYTPSGYAVSDVLSASNTHLGGSGSGLIMTITSIIGQSDGTWERFVESNGGALPTLVDPRTGDIWVHVDSFDATEPCTVYLFRNQDSFQQVISPLQPVHPGSHMEPLGISDSWVYVDEEQEHAGAGPSFYSLCLTPRTIQAQEVASDYLQSYASFDFPTTFNGMNDAPNAYAFTQHQTAYFLEMQIPTAGGSPATRAYKLYRFDEPTSAPYGGPIVGGGFTEVTPWGGSTGPNTNAADYTYNTAPSNWNFPTNNFVYYLPATNQLGILSKFFMWQTSSSAVVDPTLTFFDFTYYDIASDGFDYHHAFVTGFMSASWTPLSSNIGAAWVVLDALELNTFAKHNTFVFPDMDYTKVWFAFVVQPCTGATLTRDTSQWHTIFVEYQIAYGQAPVVLQVLDEAGWDTAYAAFGATIGNANVVQNTQGVSNMDEITDAGLYDPTTNSIWWGGGGDLQALNTAFDGQSRDSPPFLKLTFSSAQPGLYCVPFAIGATFTSRGQILRTAAPQESGTQSGPSQGKKRRMTSAAPLLFDAQGVSMGVDFLKMRPLGFFSAGGTIPLTLQQTFSGVYWGPVDATFNYDNMWCWEITRPYPCTVVAVECQLETNENL